MTSLVWKPPMGPVMATSCIKILIAIIIIIIF